MAENSNPPPTKKHSSPRPSFEVETPMRKKDSQSLSSSASSLSSSRNSQSRSQNVRQFLFALNELESLYICPITLLLPLEIRQQVPHCVQRYEIKDYQGVTRFYAVETTPTCSYTFCSDARPFDIQMFDLSGSLLLECYRNCSGTLCICGVDCCAGGVNTGVNFGSRTSYIGSIGTRSTCRSPSYMVREETSDERFIIRGPKHGKLLPCKLCGIHTFTICARNTNASVGIMGCQNNLYQIHKLWE